MTGKKWGIGFLVTVLAFLILLGGFVVVIDPFFHYHAPILGLQYPLKNQRYQNDGIVKHFEYDAIITGTSMTENFKASEFDELFNCNSIKIPFSGGSFCEESSQIFRALNSNPNLRYVICSLDHYALEQNKDYLRANLPQYLYNNSIWDDFQYIFNKDVIAKECFSVLLYNYDGNTTTSFDAYSNWMAAYNFGEEAIKATYNRSVPTTFVNQVDLSNEQRNALAESIQQNFVELAIQYPQVEFYLFFPPYSIYTWDMRFQSGTQEAWLQSQEFATELLLECDNIHLFSFSDEFEMICDPNNYKDAGHYGEWVNSQILHWMKSGEHQLTKDNYQDYYRRIRSFYSTYDYDSLFEIPEN